MQRARDAVLRAVYRVGYRVLRGWWRIAQPRKKGVKCVLRRRGEILLVRHTYGTRRSEWDLPGGGVKRGEEPVEAARREVREELGVEIAQWRFLGDLFARIDRKRDRLWCFACDVDGLNLDLDSAEIAEARWFSERALPEPTARYVPRILTLAAGRRGGARA
jgi:8-oxo-dGTP pyrophosphatase MutT (NUDIX family)